jgi:hypothetical protein
MISNAVLEKDAGGPVVPILPMTVSPGVSGTRSILHMKRIFDK